VTALAWSLTAAAQPSPQQPPAASVPSAPSRSAAQHDGLRWEAREVVKDVDRAPHLFVQLTLTGAPFPLMAQLPVVRVGAVRAHHVTIADDRRTADAYFRQLPREGGSIEFGVGDVVLFRFPRPFVASELRRLDRSRLPAGVRLLLVGP
jgi:hypothetical protein